MKLLFLFCLLNLKISPFNIVDCKFFINVILKVLNEIFRFLYKHSTVLFVYQFQNFCYITFSNCFKKFCSLQPQQFVNQLRGYPRNHTIRIHVMFYLFTLSFLTFIQTILVLKTQTTNMFY